MTTATNTPATIAVDLNDAAFLGHLLKKYIKENKIETDYLVDLYKRLDNQPNC